MSTSLESSVGLATIGRSIPAFTSHPYRYRHTHICGHEFRDIHFLVEQTPQRQLAYSSGPKIGAEGDVAPGSLSPHGRMWGTEVVES